MTEPIAPAPSPDPRIVTPTGGHAERVSTVVRYLERNRAGFTEDVLLRAARDAGYPEEVLEEARARARAIAASVPGVRRVRRWIVRAYLLTFALLAAGMLVSEYAQRHLASYLGTAILGVTLGICLLVSIGWLRWRGKSFDDSTLGAVSLISVPVVLLIAVAGTCIATGYPIPRPY
jgi:hypothetical protein